MDAECPSEIATAVVVLDPRVESGSGPVVVATWPLDHADAPCLGDIDRLARLQLAALRMGLRVRVVRPTTALVDLLATVGLDELIDAGLADPG
jgi:hypothetical protein